MDFNNDDQLKSFLKKESVRLGVSIQNTYNTFFALRLLERISKINYGEICVKGSFSELAHLNKMIRPITDIDLVSMKYHNEPLIVLYRAMYDGNDELVYELIDLPKRTKTGIYKIPIEARFGKIRHAISIDFMEKSSTLYDQDYKKVCPIFINDPQFYICTPTYEEHLAEKLCIVVESNKEDVLNTRVKDFYDLYKLHGGKYNKEKVDYYFKKMIVDRGKTDVEHLTVSHLNEEYINRHKELWFLMRDKYEFLDKSIEFEDAVYETKELLNESIKKYNLKK